MAKFMAKLEQLLIGRKVNWVETEDDEEDCNCYHAYHFAGTIVSITDYGAILQLEDDSRKFLDFTSLTQWLDKEPDFAKIRYTVLRHHGELRTVERLADQTPQAVYALIDPEEITKGWNPEISLPEPQAVHYIGISQHVEQRFQQHLYCSGYNFPKIDWIQGLQAKGLQPLLFIFEKVRGRHIAIQREQYWTKYYLIRKAPLTNNEAIRMLANIQAAWIGEVEP